MPSTLGIVSSAITKYMKSVIVLNGDQSPIINSAGKSLNVVGNTSISTTTVKYGSGSIYFNGSGDYITSSDSDFKLNEDFTIEAWVYMLDGQANLTLINTQPHPTLGISLNRGDSRRTTIWIGNGSGWLGGGSPVITSSTSLSLNQWHHVALERYQNNLTLYHNGDNVGSSTILPSGFNGDVVIGAGRVGATILEFFKGYMDDFRITKGGAVYKNSFSGSLPTGPISVIYIPYF